MVSDRNKINRVAVIGNYLPRQCGIATFTTDLSMALLNEIKSEDDLIVVAMDDVPEGYDYPDNVKFRVRANVQSDYFWSANFLNTKQCDVAILQHEYGIFGGKNGSYILQLIKQLRMPVLTTLHTVLNKPSYDQKTIIQELAKYSHRLIVMSHKAEKMLVDIYGINKKKIAFIPHGIPDSSFENPGVYNELFGFPGRQLLLTFGLLGPNKGIEYVIKALPDIIKNHPEVIYLILGQTHPHIKQVYGDIYRDSLLQLVTDLHLEDYVRFHNQFVTIDTLLQYLQTSAIYVTPYIQKEQITSGTLAYALGVGTTVVSTPYWYAEELLSDGRGILVPFNDSMSLSRVVNDILRDKDDREKMRFLAYQYGRSMIWKEVARNYLGLASEIVEELKQSTKIHVHDWHNSKVLDNLPEINLFHLKALTDDTGVMQHALYTVPNLHHGYCVDDNARALIVVSMYYQLYKDEKIIPLIQKYLAFLYYAFNPENARFRNFMSYDRRWLELLVNEYSHARALWGLGVAVKYAPNNSIRSMAMKIFVEGLSELENFLSPRSWAFTIIGLHNYLEIYGGDNYARRMRTILAEKLFDLFHANSSPDWIWCEEKVTYANANLSHALLLSGQWIPNREMYDMGLRSLEWLLKIQTAPAGHLSIIGNKDWFKKGSEMSAFDQQPIEAKCLVEASVEAYKSTGDEKWLSEAQRCLAWFLGGNDINMRICDFETGGCCDGLKPHGVNSNQGAESSLSWLIALLKMYEVQGQSLLVSKINTVSISDDVPVTANYGGIKAQETIVI